MRNVVENMISFLIIGVVLIALFISLSLGSYLINQTEDALDTKVNSTMYTQVKTDMENTKNTLVDAVKFLVYFLIALSIYSSFMQLNSLETFFMNFILAIIIGAISLYLLTNIYNTFVMHLSSVPIFDISEMFTFFYENIHMILIANICAFLIGFIFLKKQQIGAVV